MANTERKFYYEVAPQVWGMRDIFVNVYMIESDDGKDWVLVDCGLKTSASRIKKMAAALFGSESRPKCIVLTHGHFDHVGSLARLASEWQVPAYAHYLELPYLTGKSSYPPPDPSVGGGLLAWLSFLYPSKPIDLSGAVSALPEDGSVPGLKEWRYIHTPGHAPGHISLFREKDKVLIAGDAFVTTNQQSAMSVIRQSRKVMGPPTYFTYDWDLAGESLKTLLLMAPDIVATGHGRPMGGSEMRSHLRQLFERFEKEAVPERGRYVDEPAVTDANGLLYIPPKQPSPVLWPWVVAGGVAAFILVKKMKKKERHFWPSLR